MNTTTKQMTRSFCYSVGFTILFNGLYFIWLLLKSGTPEQINVGSNLAQTAGYLFGALLCFGGLGKPWKWFKVCSSSLSTTREALTWVAILIALGSLSNAVGQVLYTYYEQVLHTAPFPSWADVAFLSGYLLQMLGILLIPTSRLLKTTRLRVFLDGLIVMTALVTFSWYFILGPTMLQGDETMLAKFVGTAYPFCDLLMIFCVLFLTYRITDPTLQPAGCLFSIGLIIMVITDSIYDYQTLQNTYATGNLVDVGWPIGYMILGIAAQATRLSNTWQETSPEILQDRNTNTPSLWCSLLPYVLVPAVILLIIDLWPSHGSGVLELGVYFGGIVLVGLVLLRQIVAIRETVTYAKKVQNLNEELHTANKRLEAMATTDPLTGLPNHRAVHEQLDKEIERARRTGRPLSILFFDGDRFKKVNDTYGHGVGDTVLRELADRAHPVLRACDTLGRYGGEEFMAILPETDTEQAEVVAERIRATVASLPLALTRVKGGIHTTISLGVATYPTDGSTGKEVRDKADQAMYRAKRLGRNQVCTSAAAERASCDVTPASTIQALERSDEILMDRLAPEQDTHAEQMNTAHSVI